MGDTRIAGVGHAQVPDFQVVDYKVCGSNSVVESQPSKLLVAGSIPVSRSRRYKVDQIVSGVIV
jgi:hypothetical protein